MKAQYIRIIEYFALNKIFFHTKVYHVRRTAFACLRKRRCQKFQICEKGTDM